ncbi:MAG: hypothetical protein JNK15_02145 [Planctomycetes bacterium]|nr:hypothetical protein [Planctomycetota bacterium]
MTTKKTPTREKFACQHCGADVFVGSAVCRECGSDASTGWQSAEEIDYQGLDLPDGWREPDTASEQLPPAHTPAWVRLVALLFVVAFLVVLVGLRFA